MPLSDNEKISRLIVEQSDGNLDPGILALADAARERHGDAVRAVLFYGSCLRSGNVYDGLADLYVLVDDYKSAFNSSVLAFFNTLLPPNVFYLETPFEGHLLRAKYAVLTVADFRKGTERWFHSYLWGRFAQKTSIIYASDENVEHQVVAALERAVTKFVSQTVPQMEAGFSARDLWLRGLSLSYRSELRTEEPEQAAARLFDDNPAYYQALTRFALEALPFNITVNEESGAFCCPGQRPGPSKRLNGFSWRVRFLQGKILSVLRLLKGFFTFDGGIDYILWKIERHSGVRVEVGPGLRRFPPVAMVVIFWRLYRQNAFR